MAKDREDQPLSPGGEDEPERLNLEEPESTADEPEPEQPDAGEELPGETAQPGGEADDPWKALQRDYPWAHAQIIAQRRRNTITRQRLEDRGFVFDDADNIIADPERAEEVRVEREAEAESAVDKIVERYADRLHAAELAEDVPVERAKVIRAMSREIAEVAAEEAMGTVASPMNEIVLDTFKAGVRNNPAYKGVFEHAERIFDQLVTEVETGARKMGRKMVFNRKTLQPLLDMAVGKALPKLRAPSRGERERVSARVAGQVTLSPGNTGREREIPVSLDEAESSIIGSLARGGGVDEKTLRTAYATAKRGGR